MITQIKIFGKLSTLKKFLVCCKITALPQLQSGNGEEVTGVEFLLDILKTVGINAASYFVYKLIDWLFSKKD